MVVNSKCDKQYTREIAAVDSYKTYWPSVEELNIKQICSCLSVEELEIIQKELEKEYNG